MAKGKPPATQARFVQDAIKQVGVGGSSTIIVPKPHPATTASTSNTACSNFEPDTGQQNCKHCQQSEFKHRLKYYDSPTPSSNLSSNSSPSATTHGYSSSPSKLPLQQQQPQQPVVGTSPSQLTLGVEITTGTHTAQVCHT